MTDTSQALAIVKDRPAKREPSGPQALVTTWADAKDLARAYAVSGLRSSKGGNENQRTAEALVKIEFGAELGIGPMAAIASVHVIEGKPSISATMWAARVDASLIYDYAVQEHTDQVCVIEWFKAGKRRGVSRFSLDDAKRAGLLGKDNWRKYPMDMLFARAFMSGARRYCPAIGMGAPMYDPDEIEVVGGNAASEPPPADEPQDADFEEQPAEDPAPNRHAEGAKAAAEKEAQRDVAKAVAHELEKLADQPAISAWADENTERIEALPEKQAEALWAYVDAMQALRSGQAYRPINRGDARAVASIRRLAGLPEVDFVNVQGDDDPAFEAEQDELPDDQRNGGGDS